MIEVIRSRIAYQAARQGFPTTDYVMKGKWLYAQTRKRPW